MPHVICPTVTGPNCMSRYELFTCFLVSIQTFREYPSDRLCKNIQILLILMNKYHLLYFCLSSALMLQCKMKLILVHFHTAAFFLPLHLSQYASQYAPSCERNSRRHFSHQRHPEWLSRKFCHSSRVYAEQRRCTSNSTGELSRPSYIPRLEYFGRYSC